MGTPLPPKIDGPLSKISIETSLHSLSSAVAEGAAYGHHDISREVRYEYANLDMLAV